MMKKALLVLTAVLLPVFFLAACVPLGQPVSQQVSEAYIQTAVAGTLMAERALAAGAELSIVGTPGSPTPSTGTPEGTVTQDAQETPESENADVSPENPWMLQNWCADHVGCYIYDISNRTDSWLQVELKESDTGVTGFFTIQSKTIGHITLIPGNYTVKYTWWCDGQVGSLSENKALGSWVDVFKCPQGFYQRVNK
jgi:hypothetical protein